MASCYTLFMKLCCISFGKTGKEKSDRKKNKGYVENDYYKIEIIPGSSSTSTRSWYYTHA
ncbi:hypothetical protein [Borealpox virus]|nr:hypothetical protein [Alaskapox virus]